jgi:hypothetical protein
MPSGELQLDYYGPAAAVAGRVAFTVGFEVTQLAGSGGFVAPQLLLPLRVGPVARGGAVEFYLSLVLADLFLGAPPSSPWVEAPAGRAVVPVAGGGSSLSLAVPLTPAGIERIEAFRAGGDLDLSLLLHAPLGVREGGSFKGVHPAAGRLSFRVPRSHWVDHVLPVLGYLTRYILELDVPAQGELAEPFRRVLASVRAAEGALRRDSYGEVFVQCRNAIDALVSAFKLDLGGEPASYPNRVKAFQEQRLEPRVGGTKAQLVADELRALWGPLSAVAKPGQFTVDRPAAKHVLHSTVNILGYLGAIFAE